MGEDGAPVLVRVDQALYLVGHENKLQPITIVDLDKDKQSEGVKEDFNEDIQDTVAAEPLAVDKSMEMEKTGMSSAVGAAGADNTVAANVNWLIDIDKAQEQPKIKFEIQEEPDALRTEEEKDQEAQEEPKVDAIAPVVEAENLVKEP